MRKTVVTLACCALIAPAAFTQTRKKQTNNYRTTDHGDGNGR